MSSAGIGERPTAGAWRSPALAILVTLLFLGGAWIAFRWSGDNAGAGPGAAPARADEIALTEEARNAAGIALDTVRLVKHAARLEAPASLMVDERRTARLGSIVEGAVLKVNAEVGDRVREGALLAEIHSHVVHDLWADHRKAVAEEHTRETEAVFAKQAAARGDRLFGDKAISRHELQRLETDAVAAGERLAIAQAELQRAEEALAHYGLQASADGTPVEAIPVRTPIGGVVLEKHVTASTAVTPGQLLFVVSDLRSLWAVAEVEETQLRLLHTDEAVEVRVAAYPGESFAGRLQFVGDAVNPKTRRVTVRCDVPNPSGRLKPEMYASVALHVGEVRAVLAVPAAAIQDVRGRPVAFVSDESGRFLKREVTLGPETDGLIEVLSGLKEGERVATTGSFLLKSELLKGTFATEQ